MAVEAHWRERPEGGTRNALRLIRWSAFRLGRWFSRLALYVIAFYFLCRRGAERRASRDFLSRVHGHRVSRWRVYRHFLRYAQVILDRNYLLTDSDRHLDIRVKGLPALDRALQSGRGVLMLSAHFGSFEAVRVLSQKRPDVSLQILMSEGQNRHITELLAALNPELASGIIDPAGGGPALALKVAQALGSGNMVGIMADRRISGNQPFTLPFLGSEAEFPAGPFQLAVVTGAPVFQIFGIYDGRRGYTVHFEMMDPPSIRDREGRRRAAWELARQYVAKLEVMVRQHPENWFNFYDFWKK